MTLSVLLVTALTIAQTPAPTKAEQLQDATRRGDAAAVKKLLDEGLDVNTKFRYDATAIFYACDAAHVDVVKVLLDRGADLTIKDTFYGFTPLMRAVSPARKKTPAHNEVARLLIARGAPGADIALDAAIQEGDKALAQAVLDAAKVPAARLTDALETARAANKTEMAALLEGAGAKPYPEVAIEPARLAGFAGTYKNAAGTAEVVVTVAGSRLSLATPAGQKLTLIPLGPTSFVAPGGGNIAFQVTGDKVTGFTLTPQRGGGPQTFSRVEGK